MVFYLELNMFNGSSNTNDNKSKQQEELVTHPAFPDKLCKIVNGKYVVVGVKAKQSK